MTFTLEVHPTTNELISDFSLNEVAAQLLDYTFERRPDLNRIIVYRADGQPSEFNPCKFAAQTTELVHKALSQCETRFKVQLLALVSGHELPAGYSDIVGFCKPYTRKITLAAVVALQEYERSKLSKNLVKRKDG